MWYKSLLKGMPSWLCQRFILSKNKRLIFTKFDWTVYSLTVWTFWPTQYSSQDMETTSVFSCGWMDEENGGAYNLLLVSHDKEGNLAICDHMGGFGGHYAKWNVRQRKINTLWSHMWNLKYWTHDRKNGMTVARAGGWRWRKWGKMIKR